MSPEMDLLIEPGTRRDLSAVMTLVRRCIDDMRERGIDQWDDVYPSLERFAADVGGGSLYVASSGRHRVVGVFALDQEQDAEYASVPWSMEEEPVAVVHRLMVDPRFQGRGLARALMGFAERTAVERGCVVMRLDAFTRNPNALALYRGLGYRDAGQVMLRKGAFRCFERRLTGLHGGAS